MRPPARHIIDLSDAEWSALESLVERFERNWRRGTPEPIEECLPTDPTMRGRVLIELVHAELEFRLEAGEPARVEDYLARFPESFADKDATWGIILAEWENRRVWSPPVDFREYLHRFSAHRDEILAHVEEGQRSSRNLFKAGEVRPNPGIDLGAPDDPTSGGLTVLGKFELLEELGRGACGIVYRARDVELDRVLALKVQRPDECEEDGDRFLREARSAARLRHPGIVAVYEAGRIDETCYLACELVEGPSLAKDLAAHRPEFRSGAELTARVAEAIGFAHREGVVHRDLKPSNILLDREGRPLIADFGLARSDREETLTEVGQVIGTPAYMSPEQARGEALRVDGRSDIYSLGVILYQILTGDLPFRGHPRMILHQVIEEEPRPPRALDDRVPRDLQTICLRAMAKEPSRRYQTADEMAEDLRRFLRAEPILARPVTKLERARGWARRKPATAVLIGLVVLVSTLGGAGILWQWQRAERSRVELATSLYSHLIALAHRELAEGNAGRAAEQLDRCPDNLLGWEWFYLKRLCQGPPANLQGHDGLVFNVVFSPDGGRIASAGGDHAVRVWDVSTSSVLLTLRGHTDPVHDVAYSPDGRRLASASGDETVRIWDAATGDEILTIRGHGDLVRDVEFSPDGRLIASAGDDQVVRIWDANKGVSLQTLCGHTDRVTGVAFGPDGRRLASVGGDGTLRIWDVAGGREIRVIRPSPFSALNAVAFSSDGRRVACAGADGTVRICDTADDRRSLTLRGHSGVVLGVSFCPMGERLASAGSDGIVRIWDAESGREMLSLRGHARVAWGVAFSPSGRLLASAGGGGEVKLWDARTVQPETDQADLTLGEEDHVPKDVVFSPDGALLASAGAGGSVRIWDAAGGREVARLLGHQGSVEQVAFSPDGLRLASGGIDGTVRVWDPATWRVALVLRGSPLSAVESVAFSPDGLRLASSSVDGSIQIWDPATGRRLLTIRSGSGIRSVAFSPDGRRLASAGGGGIIRVWDTTTGAMTFSLDGHASSVQQVAFSPDGLRLASADADGRIRIWDLPSGRVLHRLAGHNGQAVRGVCYNSDGSRLASAGENGEIKVWDPETASEVLTLRGHKGRVYSVAFSTDGGRLASTGRDGTIKVWGAQP